MKNASRAQVSNSIPVKKKTSCFIWPAETVWLAFHWIWLHVLYCICTFYMKTVIDCDRKVGHTHTQRDTQTHNLQKKKNSLLWKAISTLPDSLPGLLFQTLFFFLHQNTPEHTPTEGFYIFILKQMLILRMATHLFSFTLSLIWFSIIVCVVDFHWFCWFIMYVRSLQCVLTGRP